MEGLQRSINAIKDEHLPEIPDAQLEEDLLQLQRAAEALEAERLRRLAAVDRRRSYLRDGFLSTTSWVAQRLRLSHCTAGADVRMARSLEAMPAVREALTAGEISFSSAKALAAARDSDPDAFSRAEPLLLDAARRHSVRDLQRVVAHWRVACDSRGETPEGDDALRERRRLHISPTVFGMVRVDGDLDPETGETVLTALRGCLDAEARVGDHSDRRTPAQRRADALGEICRQWADSGGRSEIGGERPHITVTMDLEALEGRAGRLCELDHTGAIRPEAARRLACDASISRVITQGRSEPLDVGRRTPVVPAGLRRAVVIRDQHCRFPGCDRPAGWCDGHHVVHWADGGPTALSNLVLLCRRHHRMLHSGFRVEIGDGGPLFRREDGSVLHEDRAPPVLETTRGSGQAMRTWPSRRCRP